MTIVVPGSRIFGRSCLYQDTLKKVEDVKTKLKLFFEKGGFSIKFNGSFALDTSHPALCNFVVVFSNQEGCPLRNLKRKLARLSPAIVNLVWVVSYEPFLSVQPVTPICFFQIASMAGMAAITPYADGSILSPESPAYLTKKCVVCNRDVTGGKAVFAREVIEAGELIGVYSGRIIMTGELAGLPENIKLHTVQVEEGQYLSWGAPNDPPDFINHSCEPNAGMISQIAIVALRRVFPGEEVAIDYAMCDGSAYDEFDCMCGSLLCRGRVSGDDWMRPELWERYKRHFSPYLLRRIQALKQTRAARTVHPLGAVNVPHAPVPL